MRNTSSSSDLLKESCLQLLETVMEADVVQLLAGASCYVDCPNLGVSPFCRSCAHQ